MSEEVIIPSDVDPSFPFWVTEEENGSLTVNWDPNHAITSVFNNWTAEQFVDLFTTNAKETINRLNNLKTS